MIGGNYWAHPNGTGPSQTGADANHDGFADAPFDLFGNQTVLTISRTVQASKKPLLN